MKTTTILALATVAAAAPAPAPVPYVQWLADSFIKRGVVRDFHYTTAVIHKGIEAAIELTGTKSYSTWYKNQVDAVVRPDGSIVNWNASWYSIDDQRFGNNVLYWYERTGEAKYKTAATTIRRKFDTYPRTPLGGFYHRNPIYTGQMWLDGIYMGHTFYSKYVSLFEPNNKTAWEDIVHQFDLIESRTRNKTTGLLVHGYDEDLSAVWADPKTGAAPNVWSRAVGWYFMALLEVLEIYPKDLPGYARLLGYYTSLAAALQKAQHPSGGYYLIMNEPYTSDKRNYLESSATSQFTWSFLRGIRLGLLPSKYKTTALKGWEIIKNKYIKKNADGTLNWEGTVEVGSLNSNGTFEVSIPYLRGYYVLTVHVVLHLSPSCLQRLQRRWTSYLDSLRD